MFSPTGRPREGGGLCIYGALFVYVVLSPYFIAPISRHFQCGVSNFLIARYDLALLNFEDAFLYLRGNEAMSVLMRSSLFLDSFSRSNYEQIGLKFKLFSAEILFNKGLTQLNLGHTEQGLADMREASRQMATDEHGVIGEAIRDRGEGYTVFSIVRSLVFVAFVIQYFNRFHLAHRCALSSGGKQDQELQEQRLSRKGCRFLHVLLRISAHLAQLSQKKLVAASDFNDAFTEFTGVKKLQQAAEENPDKDNEENRADAELSAPNKSATTPASRTPLAC